MHWRQIKLSRIALVATGMTMIYIMVILALKIRERRVKTIEVEAVSNGYSWKIKQYYSQRIFLHIRHKSSFSNHFDDLCPTVPIESGLVTLRLKMYGHNQQPINSQECKLIVFEISVERQGVTDQKFVYECYNIVFPAEYILIVDDKTNDSSFEILSWKKSLANVEYSIIERVELSFSSIE